MFDIISISLSLSVEKNGVDDMKKKLKEKQEAVDEAVVVEQEKVIVLIRTIHNKGALEYLHTFIKLMLEKWWGY